MKLCMFLFVMLVTCSVTDAIKCWDHRQQTDDVPLYKSSNASYSASYQMQCYNYQNACSKTTDGWNTTRSCDVHLGEGCNVTAGRTTCFCSSDLCNTGSNTRTEMTSHFLMATVAIVVATSCIKFTFI